ncbi:MAG TPA: hypothetical protein VEK32_04895 [Thermodesulfobacteriota bacterium]|nr:hypothetical protein [Thermodesulfobacteriota bacterium]
MSSIRMILWKLIEILLESRRACSRLAKRLVVSVELHRLPSGRSAMEVGLIMEKRRGTLGSFLLGEVGFRNIEKINWQLTSGSPSFFLPCFPSAGKLGSVKPIFFSIPSPFAFSLR